MRPIKKYCRAFTLISFHLLLFESCNSKKNKAESIVNSTDTLQNREPANPYVAHDQSPMDMSYYPNNYPILKMNGSDSAELISRLIYSRPQRKGRVLFGDPGNKSLREYGREWRLGANEATEIEFFKDINIQGTKISRGRYIIYCIPFGDKWTIILNSNLYTWGLHLDSTKDIFKVDIPTGFQSPPLEDFTMIFETGGPDLMNLVMAWDTIKLTLPIKYLKN